MFPNFLRMSQQAKRILSGILFLVFVVYYINISFFTHSHVINGVTIVHSHFHSKNHTMSGSHSESELTLISALSLFHSLQAFLFLVSLGMALLLMAIFCLPSENISTAPLALHLPARAPPFHCL